MGTAMTPSRRRVLPLAVALALLAPLLAPPRGTGVSASRATPATRAAVDPGPARAAEKFLVPDPMVSQWALALMRPDRAASLVLTEVGGARRLEAIFPELAGRIAPKGGGNLEEILRIAPTLILVKAAMPYDTADLRRTGIEIAAFPFERHDDILAGIVALGGRLGAQGRAERLAALYRDRLATLEAELAALPPGTPEPRVYFAASNAYQAFGGGMFQHSLVERAGGRSLTAGDPGGKILVAVEELIARDPEVIILPAYCGDTPATVAADAKLRDLSAVRGGRIHTMPAHLSSWDMPVPESLLGILWLAAKFHPGLRLDLDREARDFYAAFYDHAPAAGSLEALLK
jgi:iron complex transport system substrate-binding protein